MTSWEKRIQAQPMFDVLSMANQREELGFYVARMEIGDTPGFRNEAIHNLIREYSMKDFRYSPSRGESELAAKVIATQWPNNRIEDVVIGPANFLITAALAAVTSPGDIILLPDPGFPTYKLSADFLGLQIVYYPLYADGKVQFPDLNLLLQQLPTKPAAIVINNPSNPMGIAFPAHVLEEPLKSFNSKDIAIILDETYVNLVYDATEVYIKDVEATRIRSFSKEHCAPGLRIGYAIGTERISNLMSNFISLSISCTPRFIQLAVAEYLGSPDSEEFTFVLKTKMKKRFSILEHAIPRDILKVVPNSTFYALLDTGSIPGEEAFRTMLENNVATCPGSRFGSRTNNSVRISLAGKESTFENDIKMLAQSLKMIKRQ